MKIGEPYRPGYNCAHAVASEYAEAGVDLGDTFDCDEFSITFMRRLHKLFYSVTEPRDWDLVCMSRGRKRHIGVVRFGRVKHNHGEGASGAVMSDDLRYIRQIFPDVTFWRLHDQSNILPDRLSR